MIVWIQELSSLRLCPIPLGRELYTLCTMNIYINLWLCSLTALSICDMTDLQEGLVGRDSNPE